jgi:hypothetical protein
MSNTEQLKKIITGMSRLELNKFVSVLNKDLKIGSNLSKVKRAELEAMILMKADNIMPLLKGKGSYEKYFVFAEPKKRVKKMSEKEFKQTEEMIKQLNKQAKAEMNEDKKDKLFRESLKLQRSLIDVEVVKEIKPKEIKMVDKEEEKKISEEIKKLNELALKEKDIGKKQTLIKKVRELNDKLMKML